jgi:hypothetical protein
MLLIDKKPAIFGQSFAIWLRDQTMCRGWPLASLLIVSVDRGNCSTERADGSCAVSDRSNVYKRL